MIDLHCHIDLYPDPKAIARQCHEAGVYVLSVTTTPKAWHGTNDLAKEYPRIRTALGLHPGIAHQRITELPLFDALISEARYVGEIGLDGSPALRCYSNYQVQVFNHILHATSQAGGRVMSIHSRRAVDEVLALLARYPNSGIPVLHWFSGTKKQLEIAIKIGCWFSVGPAMIHGKRGRELVMSIPTDRLLTETDGPFTRNSATPFTPWDVHWVTKVLAGLWAIPIAEVEGRLLDNFRRLVTSQ